MSTQFQTWKRNAGIDGDEHMKNRYAIITHLAIEEANCK